MPIAASASLFVILGVSPGPRSRRSAEPKFADDAAEECHKLLEEGKTVDDCQEAPNPLMPESNEIIWGGAAFVVLLARDVEVRSPRGAEHDARA